MVLIPQVTLVMLTYYNFDVLILWHIYITYVAFVAGAITFIQFYYKIILVSFLAPYEVVHLNALYIDVLNPTSLNFIRIYNSAILEILASVRV